MSVSGWTRLGPALSIAMVLATTGCSSFDASTAGESASGPSPAMVLLPGDDVAISVFGVPDLDTVQRIRFDGKMSVKLLGDITAAGKTPAEFRDELTKLYASQIQTKAITVTVRSSAAVYVTGAVGRPGKVEYLRPLTALDAIMEAGGFDQRAGARRGKVHVIRTESNRVERFLLDLDEILTEGGRAPFYLKPFDTVYVPGAW